MEEELNQEVESQQIMDIVTGYFRDITGDEQKAQEGIRGLTVAVQDPGAKLVHLGDTVFLTIVRGKGFVEFHPMYTTRDVAPLVKDLNTYVNYLKNIGVQVMYTYGGEDFPYKDVVDESEFDFEEEQVNDQIAYYLKV